MAAPRAKETVEDPGIGQAGSNAVIPVIMGESSTGVVDEVKYFSDPVKARDYCGKGPGLNELLHVLTLAGGPVGYVRPATTITASNGSVTQSGGGPLVTLSGDAVVDANVRLEIIKGGALGTATFRYSLDTYSGDTESERTYSGTITVPTGGTYAIPTLGVTVTFPTGTYVAGESYTWTSNCAASNATDINAAIDALDDDVRPWRFVYLVTSNNTGDSTAHAALEAAVQAKLNGMQANSKYRRGMMPANMDDVDPLSDYQSQTAIRMLTAYGRMRSVSQDSFIGYAFPTVPGASAFAARAAGSLISTDLKRVPGNQINDGGPLPNVVKIFKDERVEATGLDAIKISLLRTYLGRSGFYISEGLLRSPDGSDFVEWPLGLVMDRVCEITHSQHETFIGRSVRTNNDGTIDERDALRLEQEVQDLLDAALKTPRNAEGTDGHLSAVAYQINRDIDVNTTKRIEATVSLRPLGYIRDVDATLSYTLSVPVSTQQEAA